MLEDISLMIKFEQMKTTSVFVRLGYEGKSEIHLNAHLCETNPESKCTCIEEHYPRMRASINFKFLSVPKLYRHTVSFNMVKLQQKTTLWRQMFTDP